MTKVKDPNFSHIRIMWEAYTLGGLRIRSSTDVVEFCVRYTVKVALLLPDGTLARAGSNNGYIKKSTTLPCESDIRDTVVRLARSSQGLCHSGTIHKLMRLSSLTPEDLGALPIVVSRSPTGGTGYTEHPLYSAGSVGFAEEAGV